MGQVIGKGRIHADAIPFINLEPDRVEKLWSHYKLHSDGFSLDPDALQHVLKVIFDDEDDLFEQKCRALFARLDTDRNNLIDALGIYFVIIETVCPGVVATFLAGDLRRWTIWQGLVPIGNT